MNDARRLQMALQETRVLSREQRWSVPIVECGEPLIKIEPESLGLRVRLIIPARREYVGCDELWAREPVCEMLGRMAYNLNPHFHLVVFDAYRPIEYQRIRFSQTFDRLRVENPGMTHQELQSLTDRLVAFPEEDKSKAPPHSTGGAVDIYLEDARGLPVDFGSEPGIYTNEQNRLHYTNAEALTLEQRENRVRLITEAITVGFCSYPGEWWHFMYGDQEYAFYTGQPYAIYGGQDT